MTGDRVQVRVFTDREALSRAAADMVMTLARRHEERTNRFTVALSGGSSPAGLYGLLGTPPYRDGISWRSTHCFWTDERCVSPDHPESNYKLAADAFLSRIPLAAANIHRVRGEDMPDAAARAYEEDLRRFFSGTDFPVFDLIILGVGEDGHTASLFPGSPSLRETARLAVPVRLGSPKRDRVTLTLPVLNHASQVLFLAPGRAKADIVAALLDGGQAQSYPAGLVRPVHGEVAWFIDRDAAAKLSRTLYP